MDSDSDEGFEMERSTLVHSFTENEREMFVPLSPATRSGVPQIIGANKNLLAGEKAITLFDEANLLASLPPNADERLVKAAFKLERTLGIGSFGHVLLAQSVVDNKYYAVKHLTAFYTCSRDRELKIMEADIMRELKSEHVVRCLAAFEQWDQLFLVMEAAPYTFDYACRVRRKLSTSNVLRFGRDMASALNTLHAKRIIHNDFKPANVVCGVDSKYKLIDFNIARYMPGHTKYGSQGDYECGDSGYLSVRGLNAHEDYERDWFALGLALFEAARGGQVGSRPDTNRVAALADPMDVAKELGGSPGERLEHLIFSLLREESLDLQRDAACHLQALEAEENDFLQLGEEEITVYEESFMEGKKALTPDNLLDNSMRKPVFTPSMRMRNLRERRYTRDQSPPSLGCGGCRQEQGQNAALQGFGGSPTSRRSLLEPLFNTTGTSPIPEKRNSWFGRDASPKSTRTQLSSRISLSRMSPIIRRRAQPLISGQSVTTGHVATSTESSDANASGSQRFSDLSVEKPSGTLAIAATPERRRRMPFASTPVQPEGPSQGAPNALELSPIGFGRSSQDSELNGTPPLAQSTMDKAAVEETEKRNAEMNRALPLAQSTMDEHASEEMETTKNKN